MMKIDLKVLSFAAVVLLAAAGGASARSAEEEKPPAKQETPAPARRLGPHVTGTIDRWTGTRIDLKLENGKIQKVAVNADTERLVDFKEGAEITVEYRRKISGFVIATRISSAADGAAAAPAPAPLTLTGTVVSWNDAALLLRTENGDVTLGLAPTTKYLVPSLTAGLRVIVEYTEAGNGKLAGRVLAAPEAKESEPK